jgi:hypothetical protein
MSSTQRDEFAGDYLRAIRTMESVTGHAACLTWATTYLRVFNENLRLQKLLRDRSPCVACGGDGGTLADCDSCHGSGIRGFADAVE